MLKFIYRKALSTSSSVFTLRRILLATVLLYMLFLRLDPGWNCIDCNAYVNLHVIRAPIECNLFSLFFQRFPPHSCGFPNFFRCSNRCGGLCLRRTIRLSFRANDCERLQKKNVLNPSKFFRNLTLLLLVLFCKIILCKRHIFLENSFLPSKQQLQKKNKTPRKSFHF